MTKEQHGLFTLATLLTLMAPALTLPTLGAWGLMWWLGRAVDESNVSATSGCGCTWAMIVFVKKLWVGCCSCSWVAQCWKGGYRWQRDFYTLSAWIRKAT